MNEEIISPFYQTLAELQNRYLQEVDALLGSESNQTSRMDMWEEIDAMWRSVGDKLDWIKKQLQEEFKRTVVENCR